MSGNVWMCVACKVPRTGSCRRYACGLSRLPLQVDAHGPLELVPMEVGAKRVADREDWPAPTRPPSLREMMREHPDCFNRSIERRLYGEGY